MKRVSRIIKFTATFFVVLLLIITIRYLHALQIVNTANLTDSYINVGDLGSTKSLRITPVFEAWARTNNYQSGHGVAYLIQTDQTTIMLDLGNNEHNREVSPLVHNLQELNQNINDIDYIVISHNHPDHVGGIRWWRKNAFSVDNTQNQLNIKKAYLPVELSYPNLETVIALEPTLIAPGIATLGRIPFIQSFPFNLWAPLGWEQSLAINVEDMGLIIVSGCGHPGLERIVEKAEQTIAIPIKGVVGGLHYLNSSEDTITPHLEFLKERNPSLVALSPHDSSGTVLQLFEQAFPQAYHYIVVGLEITVASSNKNR